MSLCAALLAVPACAPPPAPALAAADAPGAVDVYTLGPGDKLRVTVFNETSLSGEFQVNAAGIVSMPLIGTIRAAGLSQQQLEQEIGVKLAAGYVRDPRVNVEVLNHRPFYILGEVAKPGEYPYRSGMNVMSAVAVAGGFTYRASDKTVYIRRAGTAEDHSYPLTTTTMVRPGDIVRVPERLF